MVVARGVDWVVGVGASAGGLDALVRCFAAAQQERNVAFVVVQHLSPDHKSLMAELLARRTALSVTVVEDGVAPRGGTIYVLPSQHEVTMVGDRLRLTPRKESGIHHPIDAFFGSLAASHAARAIGVVLSGTGRDGTQGAMAIHAAGGLVYAQEPETAGFDGMPLSVIQTGVADAVLAPERIVPAIYEVVRTTGAVTSAEQAHLGSLRHLIAMLSRHQHIDFTHYKTATLDRRARRRQQELGLATLEDYVDHVSHDARELDRLVTEILIGVSAFFRDPEAFEVLDRTLLSMLRSTDFDGTFRAWSCGCSTGQEAYSLAITIGEAAERLGVSAELKLFATDVDRLAIERASAGVFGAEVAQQVSEARLDRYFHRTASGFQVERSLRQNVVFSVHNALRDPPFSRLDLVSCRNLLIYLQPSAQRELLARCAMALKPGGILLLGSSETLGEVVEAFEVIDANQRIYRRRPGRVRQDLIHLGSSGATASRRGERPEQRRLVDEGYRVLAKLDSPATLILNPEGMVIHTTGDVSEFFSIPVGAASLDAVRLAKGSLSTLLSVALANARRESQVVEYADVEVRPDDAVVRLRIRVAPFSEAAGPPHFLVSLGRVGPERPLDVVPLAVLRPEAFEHLEQELQTTRENLQAVIEELETSNEELQATNEELMAANEELQATNEELQATNEELATVNAESARQIQDLMELNADIDSLFASTQIGSLFLDEELLVRKFTPNVTRFISLLDRDVGRPLTHLQHTLGNISLETIARQVLTHGRPSELATEAGAAAVWIRAVPYQLRGALRGVVVSFVDVSELVQTRARLEGVMNALPEQIALLDDAGIVTLVNDSWRAFSQENGGSAQAGVGSSYLSVVDRARGVDAGSSLALDGLRSVLAGQRESFSHTYRCDSPTQERHFVMHARSLRGRGAVVSHFDVTPMANIVDEVQRNNSRYRAVFEASLEGFILVHAASGTIAEINATAVKLLGREGEDLVDSSIWRLFIPASHGWDELFEEAAAKGSRVAFAAKHRAGTPELSASIVLVPGQSPPLFLVTVVERSPVDLERLATRMGQSQKMEALGLLAGGVAHELNNVLSAIQSVVFARRDELGGEDPSVRDLDAVLAATRRGADLTRNLLGFARAGSVTRERFDLRDVAREVVGLVQRTSNVRMALRMSDQPCVVVGDRSQIAQALMNLCVNAIDAVASSGHIDVHAGVTRRGEVNYAYLSVEDDGVGMDAATVERAFEPFFTTKPRGMGTGLGLSMVYGVGKSHGGFTDIRSQPGQGATLVLGLPLAAEEVSPPAVRAPARGRGEGILIVDDDPLVRSSMIRLLERQGFKAEGAADGPSGLLRLAERERPVSLVLLDISMPEMDGLAVLDRLRRVHPSLPVLLHSGYPDQGEHTLELDSHTRFCAKPVDPPTLTQMMRGMIDRI